MNNFDSIITLQEQILSLQKDVIESSSPIFVQDKYISIYLCVHELRNIQTKLNQATPYYGNYYETTYDSLKYCVEEAIEIALRFASLLESHINEMKSIATTAEQATYLPQPTSQIVNNMALDKFNELVSFYNLPPLEKYKDKLLKLLNRPFATPGVCARISRQDIAALIVNALLRNNVFNVDFTNMMTNYTQDILMKNKLLCVLNYIILICTSSQEFIQMKAEISRNKNRNDMLNEIMISDKVLSPSNVTYDKTLQNYESDDLILMYVNKQIALNAFNDGIMQEDIYFSQCPELYAMPYFLIENMTDDETILILHMYKINRVTLEDGILKHLGIYEDIDHLSFLLINTCQTTDYSIADQVQNRIITLMSGIVNYEEKWDVFLPIKIYSSVNVCDASLPFQFFIEYLVVTQKNKNLNFSISNAELKEELNSGMEMVNKMTVNELYKRLQRYDTTVSSTVNFA